MTWDTPTGQGFRDSGRKPERGDPPSTLLVTQPPTTEVGRDACIDALTAHPPSTANLLVVTHEQSPDEWLTTWRQRIGEVPANLALIAVGATARSAGRRTPITQMASAGDQQVVAIPDPGDLTRLGIVVSERLTEWRDTEHRPVVCGGSLTAMLQWVELPVLFRFLHVFLQRLRAADALVHFHLHPDAHVDQTKQTLTPLFDRVVDGPLNRTIRGEEVDGHADALLDLLQASRRRHVLDILLEEGSTAMHDLATRVATREHTAASDSISDLAHERVRISLRHNHLAKLDTAGLVEYDEDQHTVQLAANADQIRSYLERIDETE